MRAIVYVPVFVIIAGTPAASEQGAEDWSYNGLDGTFAEGNSFPELLANIPCSQWDHAVKGGPWTLKGTLGHSNPNPFAQRPGLGGAASPETQLIEEKCGGADQ
jgi:hypothetical protein